MNQVWHPHMSENNGILYVFEHVSISQLFQIEGEGWLQVEEEEDDSEMVIR